jgi:uncharacterized protein YgiM (DUF1202 family)
MSDNINKISDEALDNVTGGARKVVYGDSTDYVNLRKGPGLSYKKVGELYDGDVVYTVDKVYNEDDGYSWTKLDNGYWVASHFLH